MKVLYLSILIFVISSCAPSNYYQLFEVTSSTNPQDSLTVSENEDLKVSFDFWSPNGKYEVFVHNKTDSNIFINLPKSHLIVNDIAKSYYHNVQVAYSNSTSSEVSSASTNVFLKSINTEFSKVQNSDNLSIKYSPEKTIIIPPKAGKTIAGLALNSSIYRDCDLYRFPGKGSKSTKDFNQSNTPYFFRNILSYSKSEKSKNDKSIKTEFWISKIVNYPKISFIFTKDEEYCGQESLNDITYFKYQSPSNFYIRYKKPQTVYFDH